MNDKPCGSRLLIRPIDVNSSCGVLVVGYLVFLSFYEWSRLNHTDVVVKTRSDRWTDVFQVLPAICFGYQVTE